MHRHYKKGPYYADEGDFATAGAVRIDLGREAPGVVTAGLGEDGYARGLLLGSTAVADGTLLGAADVYHNDGPFDVPDDYRRLNGVLRCSLGDERNFTTVTAMAYSGRWNSTDQVPERAIAAGLIDRYGRWNDIEYYYVSRLETEAAPRADAVVHPGVPRTLRAHFRYGF